MANPEDMDTGKRDNLLRASDWTQLPDAPFSDAKKAEWTAYRKALRDLPDTITDWSNITYPTEPSD